MFDATIIKNKINHNQSQIMKIVSTKNEIKILKSKIFQEKLKIKSQNPITMIKASKPTRRIRKNHRNDTNKNTSGSIIDRKRYVEEFFQSDENCPS
jgi:hypothetical protein